MKAAVKAVVYASPREARAYIIVVLGFVSLAITAFSFCFGVGNTCHGVT